MGHHRKNIAAATALFAFIYAVEAITDPHTTFAWRPVGRVGASQLKSASGQKRPFRPNVRFVR
jgi:hypothetical protein